MKALIVSLESFQTGEIPNELQQYINSLAVEPFIILDESSKIKTNNPCKETKKSKRTQAILKLNNIGHRCILTGTFMSQSPLNAYDQMNFLKKDFFSESMYAFSEKYEMRKTLPTVRGAKVLISEKDFMDIKKRLEKVKNDRTKIMNEIDYITRYKGVSRDTCIAILKAENYVTYKHIDELWERIGDVCLKVDNKDCKDLPPKIYQTYNVELSAEQTKLYKQIFNQHCTDKITVDNGLQLYLRLQDVCNGHEPIEVEIEENNKTQVELVALKENPKIDMLQEILEQLGDKQVVVWCARSKLLYEAEKRIRELGYTTAIYDGKINKQKRENGYNSFAQGETQVIFANQASGAYGLDKLKEADYAIYLCNSYSVEQRQQSENRIYRGKVERNKYIIDIICKGTCEDRVTKALKKGVELINSKQTNAEIFKLEG